MASGDRLKIADKPTLDLINANIGNTDDVGGSLNSGTVMAKLNRLVEKLENQFVFDDDFYIECSKNYTEITQTITSTSEVTVLDITGRGTIGRIYARSGIDIKVYIDDEIVINNVGNQTCDARFGLISSNSGQGTINAYKLSNLKSTPSTDFYSASALNFKESFKVIAKKHGSGTSTPVTICYGIGGEAL